MYVHHQFLACKDFENFPHSLIIGSFHTLQSFARLLVKTSCSKWEHSTQHLTTPLHFRQVRLVRPTWHHSPSSLHIYPSNWPCLHTHTHTHKDTHTQIWLKWRMLRSEVMVGSAQQGPARTKSVTMEWNWKWPFTVEIFSTVTFMLVSF